MTTTTSPGGSDGNSIIEAIAKALYDMVTSIPPSSEAISSDPKNIAQSIVKTACWKSGAIAASLALPPGPLGMLTILPDLVAAWRLQRQMVSDIAACYGKQALLNRELMAYCLFRHQAEHIVGEVVVRVGERVLVRRLSLVIFPQIIQRLAVRLSQRVGGRILSRWIIIIGAAAIGIYAYNDAKNVGATAIDVFSREIDIEGGGTDELPSKQ